MHVSNLVFLKRANMPINLSLKVVLSPMCVCIGPCLMDAECGSVDAAPRGFDRVTSRNVASWTAILGYVRNT